MKDGAWKGHRAFVVGGGESLKGFDWDLLKGELVIGVNRAFEMFPPSILFSMDLRLWSFYERGDLGEVATEQFRAYQGNRVWSVTPNFILPEEAYYIPRQKGALRYTQGSVRELETANNSGYGAVQLALALGAGPVYLLGFDMKGDGKGGQAWWHGGYPTGQNETVYKGMVTHFNAFAKKNKGVDVVNLNPDSALKCFRKQDVGEVLGKKVKRPVVVSFYTEGTGYEQEAGRLVESLYRFGLEHDVQPRPNMGGWKKNNDYKPAFILEMMEKHKGRDIVWLDSDAVVMAYPELWDDAATGIGVCGSMEKVVYVGGDQQGVVRRWGETHSLAEVVKGGSCVQFPETYCKPTSHVDNDGECVVAFDGGVGDRVTAITPTGDRLLAFRMCQKWMEQQVRRPDQWIVVDDGKVAMRNVPEWATYVRREPKQSDPQHTLNTNLQTAIPYIIGDKILVIEDDEYYAPDYVKTLAAKMDVHEVVGIMMAKYYHLPTGGYSQLANTTHASLAETGFRNTFIPELEELVKDNGATYLDLRLWQKAMSQDRGYLFQDKDTSLYLGIKGLPGRPGIGMGHNIATYKTFDHNRSTLKKLTHGDSKVYVDVIDGRLNNDNYEEYFLPVTGITVCQNTKELVETAYTSIRKFHPNMPIIIVDGSDATDPCYTYVKGLQSSITTVLQPGYNIGHGRGMCLAIDHVATPYALIFDSDIEMLKSPVRDMLDMMEPDTFAIGCIEKTGFDGFEYGANGHHKNEGWMPMIHPFFHLINVANYHKYHPYVHHGAPCYLTALDIYKKGLSDTVLKAFPGLGHTAGKGWTWTAKPSEWVRHDTAGTRSDRVMKGMGEIEGGWVREGGEG
jgi:hypothetical protein